MKKNFTALALVLCAFLLIPQMASARTMKWFEYSLFYRNNGASVEYEYTEPNRKPDALPNARINLQYVNYKGNYVDEAFRFWAQYYNNGWRSVTHAGTVQGLYHDAYAPYKSNPGQYQGKYLRLAICRVGLSNIDTIGVGGYWEP